MVTYLAVVQKTRNDYPRGPQAVFVGSSVYKKVQIRQTPPTPSMMKSNRHLQATTNQPNTAIKLALTA
jgi:hypothetical protein